MPVRDIMTRDVQLLAPQSTLREAAQRLRDDDIGSLPLADGDRLVGYVTDRDPVVRGLAQGFAPETCVHEVMTDRLLYRFEDEEAALNKAHYQVRRLPVLSRDERLVALGDLATKAKDSSAEDALEGVSKPAS